MLTLNKKMVLLSVLVVIIIAATGLYFVQASADESGHPYFPLKSGNQWVYKIKMADGTEVVRHIAASKPVDGKLRMVLLLNLTPVAEIHYDNNEQGLFKVKEISAAGTKNYEPPQQVLPAKLKVGEAWSWQSADQKSKETSKITATETVKLATGTYDTFVVEYSGERDGVPYSGKTWFAKGVGYVKYEESSEGKTIKAELADIKLVK